MVRFIDAILEDGVLRPLEPLALPNGTRFRVAVNDSASIASTSQEAVPTFDTSMVIPDPEAARRILIESFHSHASASTGRYVNREELYDRKSIP
jgi:predicted DNA-binding antitoxin AbrB/MazE fold protein